MIKNRLLPVVVLVAGTALAGICQAEDMIRINGSGTTLDIMQPLIAAYTKANRNVSFHMEKPLGSSGAIKALLAGALDIAVSSRPLKAEEIEKGARLMEYGSTPLAIVAEQTVPKTDITTQELEDIYAGRTTFWTKDNKIRIRLVLRPYEDIDTKILRELSAGMDKAMDAAKSRPGEMVAVTDPEAYSAIAKTPGALGVTGLASISVGKLPLKVLTLNGVTPTSATLASKAYPLAKQISFITTPGTPPAALNFIKFIYSPQGRAIAEKAGVLVTAKPDQGR